eukprot:6313335-Prymnesium_polylepis.1
MKTRIIRWRTTSSSHCSCSSTSARARRWEQAVRWRVRCGRCAGRAGGNGNGTRGDGMPDA